jgi:SAM-dependent methyltransferase
VGALSAAPSGRHYLEHLARLGAADIHPGGAAASERLIEALRLAPGQRVLEVGCGTGGTLVRVGSRHAVRLCGVDPMEAMTAAARRRLERAGLLRSVTLLRADGASGLPFEGGAFDRVFAESVLGFQTPAAARVLLAEIHRVLRPGGVFVANEAVWRAGTDPATVSRVYVSSLRDFGLAQASGAGWTAGAWIRCMEGVGLRVRSHEPLEQAAARTAVAGRAPRSSISESLQTLVRRARGLAAAGLVRERLKYRRLLARHRQDGRHVEAYLFVAERPRGAGEGGTG